MGVSKYTYFIHKRPKIPENVS